ncbi:ATP-binding protein [Occultella glacieicola]|uniref:ATP-binding protein n=2 Tax=Occultella glacieicola TaxID=2518684 RepID=A0ABY2E0H4_9MICO|nr:ATP-binding protein [Occultella glacieicola]
MLIVMSGPPGSGKSHLAGRIARALTVPVLSVDPVEAAMWRAGVGGPDEPTPTGLAAYVVVEALAEEILSLGQSVLVDAVNAVEPAREQWRALARRAGVEMRVVEVVCSDPVLHRSRLEGRRRNLAGFREPTWGVVSGAAAVPPWTGPHLRVDTADPADPMPAVLAHLGRPAPDPANPANPADPASPADPAGPGASRA